MTSPSKVETNNLQSNAGESRLLDLVCLFLDCQTTGASPGTGGKLLETAWCTGSASGDFSQLTSQLIKQPEGETIPFRIQMITGIADDDMVDSIEPNLMLARLLSASENLHHPRLCVIHYARFETPFLNLLMQDHGGETKWPFQTICTFEIARRLYPNLPSRGIRALGGFLGIDLEEVKRSPSHVEATRVIWQHLVQRLEEGGITTLEQLNEFLSQKAVGRTGKLEYPIERLKRLELPKGPGVYRMLSQNGRVLYVGKATSLKSRVNSHFRGRKNKTSKSKELLTQVADIQVTECGSPLEAALLETDEIKRLDPPYNISLKQRSRSLLFSSCDFLSYSETQDELHSVGPFPNARALDALVRLNATINDGIVDPLVLFEALPLETLVEGLDVFLERHSIDKQDGMTPRTLIALGMSLFRSTRRELRRLALAGDEDIDEIDVIQSDEFDEEVFEEDAELTPEDVANRLESLIIGVARGYLISKEMTKLLNSNVRFEYKKQSRDLIVREGRVYNDKQKVEINGSKFCHWKGLDVGDYDRMRVLLTEVVRMQTTSTGVEVEPPLVLLSRW